MKNSTQRTLVGQNPSRATSKHGANLQKNSTLYFQIGLIVALLLSIFLIKYKSPLTAYETKTLKIGEDDFKDWDKTFRLEPKKQQPVKKLEQVSKLLPPEVVPDEMVKPNDLIPIDQDSTSNELSPEDIVDVEKEEPIEEVPLDAVEFVPIYPGCENLESNAERKSCLQENLKKLITKNFDTDRVQDFASRGLNRINVQFTVDNNGFVTDVKARAANEQLENEARRVINKIPHMQPGMKQGKKVKVIYGQPILFKIDN
ncbi:MAG TPA: hypothetical protein ENH91_07715 [Leeuwenhoekiella sp.]|nr:hypothetical protein [Leeuwenhoekiella sp.]